MLQILYRYYSDLNHIIYHITLLIGILTGLLRFKKIIRSSRIFLLLLVLTLFVELTAYYCAITYHDNRFIYNPFNLFQFTLIWASFYLEMRLKPVLVVFIIFMLFTGINMIFYQPLLSSSNSNTFLVEHLLIIILYFMYLVAYYKNADQGSLRTHPLYWIGLGWLLFSITSVVAFGFGYIISTGSEWDNFSVWVKKISNYLLYLSIVIAFLSPQKNLRDVTTGK